MPDRTNADVIASWSRAPLEAAEQHGDQGDFARQHLLNPVILDMLGNVQGKQILDAGCGQGYLCRLLARQGAQMTGLEPAESWYRYACMRETQEPLSITFIQQDLSTFNGYNNQFDCVVANMVLMDIPDYQQAIRACIRALKPGGSFIFSISHPCFEEPASAWAKQGYVAVRAYFEEIALPSMYGAQFHRPLSAYLNFMSQEDCVLQRMVEPQLAQELAGDNPSHLRNVHVPQFLVVHGIKKM